MIAQDRRLGQKLNDFWNTVATKDASNDVNIVRLASVVEQVGCYLLPWSFQPRIWYRLCTVLSTFLFFEINQHVQVKS